MWRRTVDSETEPTGTATYDVDHNTLARLRSGMTSLATISRPCAPAICSCSSPQRAATRPPRIRHRYFEHHTTCSPKEHTPAGVQRKLFSDTPRTLRGDTDKPTTTRCSPAAIPPTAQAAGPFGAH